MDQTGNAEQLTPLDVIMPRTYVGAHLAFRTTEPISSVVARLQIGLDRLSKQIPWISGHVFPKPSVSGEAPGLEIRWDANLPAPTIAIKDSIDASFEALSAKGLPPSAIPAEVSPVPALIDDTLFAKGCPVFGASLYRFSDGQGMGLCVSIHHNAVDATGFTEIVRLWVQSMASTEDQIPVAPIRDRARRLGDELSPQMKAVASQSTETLYVSHPEYSKSPPAFPTEFPSSTCKLFSVSVARIESIKKAVSESIPEAPTTNTVVCGLLWSAVTRARMQRNASLARESSQLAMAVDGRRRLSEKFSTPENPYFGNAVLYSLAKAPVDDLTTDNTNQSLANIFGSIIESQSSKVINLHHIAQVHSLVDRAEDYRAIFVGWDLFSSRDFTITSWAGLNLYDMDFGPGLGKPEFIRVPYTEADGVGIVLPRKRVTEVVEPSDEVIEIMVMLRRDDMAVLEKDEIWNSVEN